MCKHDGIGTRPTSRFIARAGRARIEPKHLLSLPEHGWNITCVGVCIWKPRAWLSHHMCRIFNKYSVPLSFFTSKHSEHGWIITCVGVRIWTPIAWLNHHMCKCSEYLLFRSSSLYGGGPPNHPEHGWIITCVGVRIQIPRAWLNHHMCRWPESPLAFLEWFIYTGSSPGTCCYKFVYTGSSPGTCW